MSDYNRYYGGDDRESSGGQQPYSTEYYTVGSPAPAPQSPKKKHNRGLMVFLIVVIAVVVLTLGTFAVTGIVNFAQNGAFDIQTQSDEKDTPKLEQQTTPTPQSSKEGEELTVREVAEKLKPSVVGIVSETGVGTGVVMTEDGYIITNAHVVEGSSNLTVYLDDEQKTQYPAKIVGLDTQTDVAVIKAEATGLTAAEFGDSDALAAGDQVVAIGNPGGLTLQNSVTVGYVSAVNRSMTTEDGIVTNLIQTDAAINPGNSGGALINMYGQVIGINSSKITATDYEGLGFAIPINTVKDVVDESIAHGYVSGRPKLGITGRDVSQLMMMANGLPQGVLIVSVEEDSDAYAKGIRAGDVITGFGETKIDSMTTLNAEKEKYKAGDTVALTVYRDGQEYTVNVTLSEDAGASTTQQQQQTPQYPGYGYNR